MMRRGDFTRGGLTDRKICVAVTIGILLGIILSVWNNSSGGGGGEFDAETSTGGPKHSDSPALSELRSKLQAANEEYTRMKDMFDICQAERLGLKQQLEASSVSGTGSGGLGGSGTVLESVRVKAGPRGTVKSQRTNPLVEPDFTVNPELADVLKRVALKNEVLVAISNNYIREMLRTWFENVKRAGITNYLVIALDDEVAQFLAQNEVPYFRRNAKISDAQKGTGDNHAISGSKFHLLRDILVMGYSVLLSDVDVVYLKNPFNYLYRDCDVESMTDGFDNYTAYGYDDVTDDPTMGWARYAHTMRVFVFNSGLFYIRATIPSIELLDRVTERLSRENSWDQAVFNEELFFPSRPNRVGLHASRRTMDFYDFMNSKVLFKQVRKDPRFHSFVPVAIHVNYHPEKHPRMLAIVEKYVDGKANALDKYPDGSMF